MLRGDKYKEDAENAVHVLRERLDMLVATPERVDVVERLATLQLRLVTAEALVDIGRTLEYIQSRLATMR